MNDLTALILCGGKGERLKPLTEAIPKPLVPLSGRPLLYHLMRYLSLWGLRDFILCTGYKSEGIEEFVRAKCPKDWKVRCSNAGEAVSMTDRILHAREHLSGKTLVCYGDTLANIDLHNLREEHERHHALATLSIYPFQSPFGIVHLNSNKRITRFQEKPVLPYWINIGFLLCEPEAFDFLKPQSDMPEFLSALSKGKVLYAYKHHGRHLTINTEKERQEANRMIQFFTFLNGGVS